MIRFYSIILAALSLPVSALAAPATDLERYYLGEYAVRTEDDQPTRCEATIAWADDVGGEVSTRGCEAWPDLAEAARWHFDADAGEARFEDPLRRARFRVAETDAGFVAILSDDTRLWLANKPGRRKR